MKIYLKLAGDYLGLSPEGRSDRSIQGDAKFEPYADRHAGGPWEELELTQHEGGKFDARFIAANRQLSYNHLLESRVAGTVSEWETFYATTQPEGTNFLYRIDEHGNIIGSVFTIEEA